MIRRHRVRSRSLLLQLVERALGRGQAMLTAGDRFPLVLTTFPRGRAHFAMALGSALRVTFPSLSAPLQAVYHEILARVPSLIVADLRARNLCTCLGHHHPVCTPQTQQLATDSSCRVGEIDLALDAIREWEPRPLASLAATDDREAAAELARMRFQTALLSVFLHELEHVAYPERSEAEIRSRSDTFYLDALREQVSRDFGVGFGLDRAPAGA